MSPSSYGFKLEVTKLRNKRQYVYMRLEITGAMNSLYHVKVMAKRTNTIGFLPLI